MPPLAFPSPWRFDVAVKQRPEVLVFDGNFSSVSRPNNVLMASYRQ
jgi:hypothetical protein